MRSASRRLALLLPVVVTATVAAVGVVPADAAVFTSSGVRCTVTGTSGSDVLVGTAGRDVICGRGGSDVIKARGGNDLVDAGSGADRVYAGDGADTVLAGAGADQVQAGSGTDRVVGGTGADTLQGDGGADRLAGGDGTDTLEGDGGGDTVFGGDGADTIEGGTGADDLNGQVGNDDLTGDGGADDLDGGAGTNICIVDAADESIRCKYDEQPPAAVETQLDPGRVDVTKGDAQVTVRVHATDDTGVTGVQVWLHDQSDSVQLGGPALLPVSGDERDGWWEETFTIARYTKPATLRPRVYVIDRLERMTTDETSPTTLQVDDANPDTELPQMSLTALDPASADVRNQARDVTVAARVTDPLSGVDRVDLCLSRPDKPLYTGVVCQDDVPKASGTIHDGVWSTVLRLPKGSPDGVYNVTAYADDRAHTGGGAGAEWMGPDAYKTWMSAGPAGPEPHQFPDGAGRITVVGATDTTPAWTDSVTVSPTEVDTLPGPQTTHVTVQAKDAPDEGVTRVMAVLRSDSQAATAPQFDQVDLTLDAGGSMTDGTWQGDLTLPQGTPQGTYHVLVFVTDITHSTGFVGPSSPDAQGYGYQVLDSDPLVTVVAHQ